MAGMFDDLVPGGQNSKAQPKAESGPWDSYKPAKQTESGPWSEYQGGAFDDLVPKSPEKSSLARRLIGDTAVSAVKGAIGLTEVPVGIADMATGGMAGKALEGIGYRPKEAKTMLDEMYSPEQKAANKAVSDAEGFFGTAKAALQNPSTIGQSVIESAPLLLPGAAIARGVGAAGKIAPVVAGGIGEGVVGAGLAAEQMRQNYEDGTLSALQTGAALASGAGTAAFGIAGGKLAQSAIGKKLGLADVDTALAMSPAQRAAAGGIDAGIAKRIAGGAVSEGVLEELPQSMWEQAAQNYGEGKPIGEGVAEAGAMGALAGGVMGGGFNALQGRMRGTVEQQPPAQEAPRALPAPTYTGTPSDQTIAAEVERANQVAAAQANADAIYAERAAFEQERAPAKLPVTGPMSAAVNVGIDSGATSITSPANPRYEIPAKPRGSFSQQDELASLIGQERADVADRRELAQLVGQERRDQERRIAEAADSRRALDSALADTDQRAAGVAAQESEAARLRLLDNILSSISDTGNPARQFGNALRRAGYRNTDFTERERQVIQRFSDARAALRSPEATTVPSAPNELDAASLGIRERSTAGAMQGASGRDKIGEAVSLLSQGWKLALNKTLVSPTGKKRKLNAEEFAAVREARAKMINKTEAGNAATQVDAVSDQGRGDVAAGGIGNAQPMRSIARGRGGNAGASVPGMRAAGAVGNAGGAGSALNAAQPEQVAQKAAQANGQETGSQQTTAPAGEVGISQLSDLALQQAGEYGLGGAMTEGSMPQKDWAILEQLGLIDERQSEDGTTYRAASMEPLFQERSRRHEQNMANRKGITQEERDQAIEKRARNYERIAEEQDALGGLGDAGLAQQMRSKAAEIRSGKGVATVSAKQSQGQPVDVPSAQAKTAPAQTEASQYQQPAANQNPIKNAEAAPAVTRTKDTLSDTVYSKSEADRVFSSGGGVRVRLNDGSSITFINLQDDEGYGDVHAYSNDGKRIGLLGYFTTTDYKGGPIEPSVHVEEQYRRKGIASAMYDIAEQTGGIIPDTSSRNAWRSEDGQAFRLGRDAKNKAAAQAALAGAQQQQKEPKNGMQEGRRQEEVAAQTPAVTTPPEESFGLVEPVKDLSEASRQALYESLKDRLTKGEITLQYGQRQMAAFDEAVKAEEEAKSGAQEAKRDQSKPEDVSKTPKKTNMSGEHVQKTAENEQVESADKLDPAKIRASRTVAEEPPSDSTGQNFESRSASPADAEFSATERAYGGREAFDRAKAAGKTKLNYRQWVQVRTPKFKEWFGDWEAAKENESFNAILKQVENGAIKSGTIIQLGTAGSILNQFGIPSLKIEMTQSVLSQHMKKHGIGFDHLRDLAAHVQAPIAVFKSKRSADSVILLTEIQHPDGDLVVALQANKERNRLVINDIRSIHPKPSQKIDFWIDDGLLIGVDESRGRHLLSTTDRSNSGRGERQEASDVILFNTEALRNVSKVVDPETGEPLVVYHGTTADINEFRPAGGRPGEWQRALDHFKKAQNNNDRYGYMNFRDGSFFSPKPEYAGNYTGENGGVMYQAFVVARNPVYFDMSRKNAASGVNPDKTPDALMLYSGDKSNLNEIAVIDPTQVKSATGNNGNFDGGNPDIRESRAASQRPWYFSPLAKAFEMAKPESMPAGMWKSWLSSNSAKLGVKQDEIQWSGINDWLELRGKEKTAKADILDYLDGNGVKVEEVMKGELGLDEGGGLYVGRYGDEWAIYRQDDGDSADPIGGTYATQNDAEADLVEMQAGQPTKYSQYAIPGGENYRELLLTLPIKSGEPTRFNVKDQSGKLLNSFDTRVKAEDFVSRNDAFFAGLWVDAVGNAESDKAFKSSHWDEKNILAHVRFNDRTDAAGNKVLFIEELQSDWGQEGKKKGFAGSLEGAKKFYGISDENWANMSHEDRQSYADEMTGRIPGVKGGVPNAPFVTDTKSWLSLGLKRMIAYAVENGYDKVAFVNGQQSADRYDLSKQISRLEWKTTRGEEKGVLLGWGTRGENVLEKELNPVEVEDYVGKEVASRLINAPVDHETVRGRQVRRLSGVDLKVGGEGMKTFYDKIVPQVANDVLRKLGGGKVDKVQIGGLSQIGFDVTDAIREKAMGGLPLFSKSAGKAPVNAQQKFALSIVQKTADRFRAEYAGASALDIRVVYSNDDIPEFFRPSPYAEGVYHDREGIIYLVAANLPTRQRSWQVLMHETVGHYGLANMMGDQFSSLWETVLKRAVSSQPLNRNPQPGEANYETVDAVRRLYPEASDAEVAQEVLARMAETMPNVGWFRMAMARIRVWLKNAAKAFGLKLEPTMADVRRLVELAGYHVRSGANLGQDAGARDVAFASQATGRQSNIASMPNDTTASGQQNAPAPEADIGEAKYGGIEYTPAPKDRISANRLRKINARGLAHAQTGDWESYYTPIFHIAYQLGQNGVDISGAPIVEGIRYGASPEFGVSKNYTDDIAESGLSLAMLRGEREISSSIWFKDRKAHEYRGLLVGNGSDGEPTILPLHVENLDDASAAESINNEPSASAGSDVMESRSATIGRNESIIDQMRNAGRRMAGNPTLDESDPFAAENARLREQDKSLWAKAKTQLRRHLSPGGLLPQPVFAEKIKRDSEFQAVEFDIRHLIGGLERAAKSDFGVSFDKLSDAQMSQISEALAGSVPAGLPEATKVAAVAMRQYIDGMSSEYLKIIQDKIDAKMERAIETGKASDAAQAINDIELYEKIKGNIGRYVHRSYQAFDDPKWFEKVPTSVLNSARAYLKQGYVDSGETDAKAAQLAEVTLHEILKNGTAYDSMEAFIAESKLGAKDLSVLMRRKDVPPEIRALLGEYSDARLNFTKSATKMGRLIWNTRFLDRVRDIGMGSFFFEGKDRPPAATTQIAAEGSEIYSPLNGIWTFPEIAQAFKDAMGKEQMSELYRAIVRASGIVKYGKTVLSPTTAMRNWQSAMFFSLANGHFDLTQMKKSIAAFREQVSQKATGNDLKYLRHLKQLGVVYDTPYAGEMARLLEDAKMEELLSSDKGDAVRWFRKANQIAQGFYAFGDDFWKIIGFENEKSGLMKAGLSLQDAEIEAAKRIRNTYPTYSMVGRGVQWLSRFPLAGTFVSFPAEIIRTSSNMLRTVASDLKSDNPKLRELGMRRAAGMAFVSAAFWALSALSKAMVGVDDDEEEAIRDLAPEWQKNSTFLFAGRDEKGNLRYFDMSFLDPYGYWKRPITAMMRDQPWEDSLASGLRGMLEPFLGADITAGAIFEAVANQKESGGKVYKENDGVIDQAVDIADHLRKALQPGFVGNIERITKAAADVRKPSGQPYSMEDELVALGGWRATTVEPKTALYYRSFEFTDAIAEARKTLSDTLRDANSVSEIDIEDAKARAAAKQEKAFIEMRRLIGAAESAGLSKMQVMQTLRLSNVSQQNIAALMQGRVPPVVVTPQMRMSAVSQARTMRGEEFANEVSDRYRMAMGL